MLLFGTTFAKDGQTLSSAPDRFLIARHSFIDVGLPNDFYEIISVRGTSTNRTTVESGKMGILDFVSGNEGDLVGDGINRHTIGIAFSGLIDR